MVIKRRLSSRRGGSSIHGDIFRLSLDNSDSNSTDKRRALRIKKARARLEKKEIEKQNRHGMDVSADRPNILNYQDRLKRNFDKITTLAQKLKQKEMLKPKPKPTLKKTKSKPKSKPKSTLKRTKSKPKSTLKKTKSKPKSTLKKTKSKPKSTLKKTKSKPKSKGSSSLKFPKVDINKTKKKKRESNLSQLFKK